MSAFKKQVRTMLEQAGREAQLDRSSRIEAQHLLLAIAAQPDTLGAEILSSVGLDHGALRQLLEREYANSLRVAGVSLEAFGLPRGVAVASGEAGTPGGAAPVTKLGTSVRTALERGVSGVRRNPRPEHLLIGILRAEQGTVPRALALGGVDRRELLLRVQNKLMKSAA
jgi:ATP-dependent Clp protease ATP-binding subunit ClpA